MRHRAALRCSVPLTPRVRTATPVTRDRHRHEFRHRKPTVTRRSRPTGRGEHGTRGDRRRVRPQRGLSPRADPTGPRGRTVDRRGGSSVRRFRGVLHRGHEDSAGARSRRSVDRPHLRDDHRPASAPEPQSLAGGDVRTRARRVSRTAHPPQPRPSGTRDGLLLAGRAAGHHRPAHLDRQVDPGPQAVRHRGGGAQLLPGVGRDRRTLAPRRQLHRPCRHPRHRNRTHLAPVGDARHRQPRGRLHRRRDPRRVRPRTRPARRRSRPGHPPRQRPASPVLRHLPRSRTRRAEPGARLRP